MITRLSLENFKSWKCIDKMRFAPITGLFGTNSSGKTSILQWLLALKQTVESPDRTQPLDLGDSKSFVELGTFRDILHSHVMQFDSQGEQSAIKWTLNWSLNKKLEIFDPTKKRGTILFEDDHLEQSCRIEQWRQERFRVSRLSYRFAGQTFSYEENPSKNKGYKIESTGDKSFSFKRVTGRPWDLPSPVKCYGFADQVTSYYKNAGFLLDLQLAFEQLFEHVYYLGPLREYPHREYSRGGGRPADMGRRGEQVINAILASRETGEKINRGRGKPRLSVEEYVSYWLREMGLIESFQVEAIGEGGKLYQVRVKKTKESKPVLITDVGFGISQILPVIALCYYVPMGSTIILEQPEIHLHPSVQADLADVFIDAIKVRKIQIILESHSEHLLRRLQRRIAEEALQPDQAALYFCEYKGSESHLLPLSLDEFGRISNWPDDFFGDEYGEINAMAQAMFRRQAGGAE